MVKNILWPWVTLICGFVLGLVLVLNIKEDLWYIIYVLVLSVTALAIGTQAYWTRIIAEFTVIPRVGFELMSGEIYHIKYWPVEKPNLTQKLNTQLRVYNYSDFPICFSIEINTKLVDLDNNEIINKDHNKWSWDWRINPRSLPFPAHNIEILYETIMNEALKYTEEDYWSKPIIDESRFEKKKTKLKAVLAKIEFSYRPLHLPKKLKTKIDPEEWRFDLTKFRWIDSNHVAH